MAIYYWVEYDEILHYTNNQEDSYLCRLLPEFDDSSCYNNPCNNPSIMEVHVDLTDGKFEFRPNCDYLFYGARNIVFSNVGSWDTSMVTSMQGMFMESKIDSQYISSSPDLSSLDVSNVQDMSYIFDGISGYSNINTNGWDLASVSTLAYAFYDASSPVTMSAWDVSNVSNFGGTFGNNTCSSLNIAGWTMSSATTTDYMFANCSNLSTIYTMPYTDWELDYPNITSSDSMFSGSNNLPGYNDEQTNIGKANNTKGGYFTRFVKLYAKVDGNNIYLTNEPKEGTIDEPKDGYTLVTNTQNLCRYKNVIIELYHDAFILPSDCGDMFARCTNTTFNDMTKWDTADVYDASGMFANCGNLTNLNVSSWDMHNLGVVVSMFNNCANLESVLAAENTNWFSYRGANYWNYNYNEMFQKCTKLPNFDKNQLGIAKAHNGNGGYFGIAHIFRPYNIFLRDGSWLAQELWLKDNGTWNKYNPYL